MHREQLAPSAASAAPAESAAPQRWTYTVRTQLGDTQSSLTIDDTSLRYETDDVLGGGSVVLRWDRVGQGATAAMAGMGGKGGPDLPRWVPAQLEWLVLSVPADGTAGFMRVLPQGADRDAIVAAVRARLGPRWIGEGLSVHEAQRRLGVSGGNWGTLKVVGIVVAVMALLVGLVILMGLLLHPVVSVPLGAALGGWVLRKGLFGLRDGVAVANTPTAQVAGAALGLVELEGRAVTDEPTPSAITGRPCAWWDATVHLWYLDGDRNGEWKQVAARYGGRADVVELEDDTGRVPIWLKGAEQVLQSRVWESDKDALPPGGLAWLDELGFPWAGNRRIRVSETAVEAGATLYVLGTLDERGNLPPPGSDRGIDHLLMLVRSGRWRRALVGAVPGPARIVVAVLIGYLDLLTKIGSGGERAQPADVSEAPTMPASSVLVWQGRAGRPFLVSNQPESQALAALRRRSLWTAGIGAAILCFTLYQLVQLLVGT